MVYEGKQYELKVVDVVFIDCRKVYSHSTGNIQVLCDDHSDSTGLNAHMKLWLLRWCHFYGSFMLAIYAKYCERGGLSVIRGADVSQYADLLTDIDALVSSSDYIWDMGINGKLNYLLIF